MSESSKYRPDIDGLRAIAVLAVVAFHAAPGRLPAGFIGVDVFFVISGFLISSILLNSLEKDKFSILEFYERRVRRIFPALFVVLLTCAVAGWFFLLPSEYQQLGKHIVAGTAFVSNFALWNESGYFDVSTIFKPLLHLWSLGIEEQFYFIWPVALWVAHRRNWSLLLTISALAVGSFILNLYLTGTDKSSAFYLPLPRFWELLIGALMACSVQARKRFESPALNHAQSALGMLLLAAGFVLISEQGAFPGWWVLMPVIGSALLIAAGPQAVFNRFVLSNRVMVGIGLISYPLYLWHWPLLSFPRIMEGTEILQYKRAIAVATAFILAWLTYQFIEKPVRNAPRSRKLFFALLLIIGAIAVFGGSAYFTGGFKDRAGNMPKVINEGDIGHVEFLTYINNNFNPCMMDFIKLGSDARFNPEGCLQSKPDNIHSMALVGDSHAQHLFIGLAEALPNENIVFYPSSGLPVIGNHELDKRFIDIIASATVKTVVLNAIWQRKVHEKQFADWNIELERTVAVLAAAGKTVYLVDDVPTFPFLPSRCKFSGRVGIDNLCSMENANGYLQYRPIFDAIARKYPNVFVLKTYETFCNAGTCSMAKDGKLLFRDENHLNISGSKKIGLIIDAQMENP